MELIIKVAAALLPAILLMVYIWYKDPVPEPTRKLIGAFFGGIAICLPVATVELFVQQWLFGEGGMPATFTGAVLNAFCVAAIPEETAKWLILWLLLRRNEYFDEHFDGVVYAVYVSLGFAAIENIFYVLGQDQWLSVAVARALLAVPGHYAFGIMMGYYYSIYHFVDHSPKYAIGVLLAPIMAHGVYDSIAMSSIVNPYVGIVSFVVLIYFCIKLHKLASERVQYLIEKNSLN